LSIDAAASSAATHKMDLFVNETVSMTGCL
jgi:hypothetical protein